MSGNALALQGLTTGTHADGAVFAFDPFETGVKDNAVVEGPRTLIDVMY